MVDDLEKANAETDKAFEEGSAEVRKQSDDKAKAAYNTGMKDTLAAESSRRAAIRDQRRESLIASGRIKLTFLQWMERHWTNCAKSLATDLRPKICIAPRKAVALCIAATLSGPVGLAFMRPSRLTLDSVNAITL